jgi:hypothetical protein
MLRNAAFASNLVASMRSILPRNRPCSANTAKTHPNTACLRRSGVARILLKVNTAASFASKLRRIYYYCVINRTN